jgi:cell fate (sporulation/competence/biofilm development) regulator YlbF (YheA/YmcA/DUF963 family)
MNTSPPSLPFELLEATQTLAAALAQAEPIVAYREARARLDADGVAHGLLERVAAAQADLRVRQTHGTLTHADIDQVRALQRQAQLNHAIMDYIAAQQSAMAYLPDVSLEISRLLGADFGALIGRSSCKE